MARIGQDVDQLTGLITTYAEEDGKFKVNYQQNDTAFYERLKALRAEDDYWKQGVKNNMAHVLSISSKDVMQMIIEDGFNPIEASAKEIRVFLERRRDKYGHVFATRRQA